MSIFYHDWNLQENDFNILTDVLEESRYFLFTVTYMENGLVQAFKQKSAPC